MGYGILPKVGNTGFLGKSREFSSGALGARSAMRPDSKTTTTPPGKTAGGGIMAGLGGAGGGAGVAMALGLASNPAGWVVAGGAALAGLAYYLG